MAVKHVLINMEKKEENYLEIFKIWMWQKIIKTRLTDCKKRWSIDENRTVKKIVESNKQIKTFVKGKY